MHRWGLFAVAYALLAGVAVAAGLLTGEGPPITHPGAWLTLGSPAAHLYSAVLGLAFGAALVVGTRASVERFHWARRLHQELRPFASRITTVGIVLLALASATGEELLFRGLLQPWLGLLPQALLFGLVHQLPGPSRWVWVAWAGGVGVLLGALFQLTGSILGPIAAHALVNGLNLAYLRSHDVAERTSSLGGLLGERSRA